MNELITNAFIGDEGLNQEKTFVGTLPPGKPTLSITVEQFPEDFGEAIAEMSEENPLDFLRLLKFFKPSDRVRMLQLGNWDRFAEGISHVEKNSEVSLITEAAREALGVENTRNLAFNFTKRPTSREHQKAAIRLAGGLPLVDISGIFTQFANIARAGIEWPMEGDDAWIDFFYEGMHSLYICTMTNRESCVAPAEEATEILEGILNEDMLAIAKRIEEPAEALNNVSMMERIRECMVEPQPMDRLMSYFGYRWQGYEKPKREFYGQNYGEYKK